MRATHKHVSKNTAAMSLPPGKLTPSRSGTVLTCHYTSVMFLQRVRCNRSTRNMLCIFFLQSYLTWGYNCVCVFTVKQWVLCHIPSWMLLWRWLMMAVRMVDRFITWAHWARPRVNSSFQQARTKLVLASWLRVTEAQSENVDDNTWHPCSKIKHTVKRQEHQCVSQSLFHT